jgi:hypothetical protein
VGFRRHGYVRVGAKLTILVFLSSQMSMSCNGPGAWTVQRPISECEASYLGVDPLFVESPIAST